MAKAKKLEDLEIWKSACRLAVAVVELTDSPPLVNEWAMRDQIRRSAISVPSNIAEGFERDTNRDFTRILWIAKGSLGELKTQLYIAQKTKRITNKSAKSLISECNLLSRQVGKLIQYLRKHPETKSRNPQPETRNSKPESARRRRKPK